MIWKAFSFASLVSLLFCVGAIAAWGRSESTIDLVFYGERGGHLWRVKSYGGVLSVECLAGYQSDQWLWASYGYKPGVRYDSDSFTDGSTEWWGGSVFRGTLKNILAPPQDYWVVVLRYWLVLGVMGLLPFAWVLALLRNKRRRRRLLRDGRCPACSYSLIGNASGVCPECGEAVVKWGAVG